VINVACPVVSVAQRVCQLRSVRQATCSLTARRSLNHWGDQHTSTNKPSPKNSINDCRRWFSRSYTVALLNRRCFRLSQAVQPSARHSISFRLFGSCVLKNACQSSFRVAFVLGASVQCRVALGRRFRRLRERWEVG